MKSQKAFTLVEMVIVVTILGIALSVGIPEYTQWLKNVQIRNHAESIQTGLLKARTEALRRNTNVSFWLVKTPDPKILASDCTLYIDTDANSKGVSWIVSINSPSGKCNIAVSESVEPIIFAKHAAGNGGAQATVSTTPSDANVVTFNGLGQIVASGTPITAINVAGYNSNSADKNHRVILNSGGMIKICDPTILTTTDSRYCS